MMAGFPRSERSLQAEAHLSGAFRMVRRATLASMPSRLHVLSSRCRAGRALGLEQNWRMPKDG